jgi:hypothetical protein
MRDNLRRVRDFRTDNPADLKRQLNEFEANVSAMGGLLQDTLQPVLSSRGALREAVAVAPGQFVTVDTSAGDVNVTLDAPNAKLSGKWAVVIKLVAANAIALSSQSGTVDAAASVSFTSAGAYLLFCDGGSYWSI